MHDVVQNAVNTEADAQFLLVRFHVNVRSAASQCVHQQNVDQSHDRRVGRHSRQSGQIDLFVVFNDFDIFATLGRREIDAVQ